MDGYSVLVSNDNSGPNLVYQVPADSVFLVTDGTATENSVYQVQDSSSQELEEGRSELYETYPDTYNTSPATPADPSTTTVQSTDHDPEPYLKSFCRQCAEMFPTYEKLKSHNADLHGGLYMCSICYRGYDTTFQLKQHILTHSVKRFKCPLCSSTFSRQWCLNRHQRDTHQRTALCEQCGKYKDVDHVCFTCTDCTARFKSAAAFERHECLKTKVYTCPYCSEQFTRRTGVINHIRNEENKRKFGCGHCDMRFNTMAQLRRHERTHDPSAWYKCTPCNKRYATASGLRMHNIKKHDGHTPNSVPPKSRRRIHYPHTNLRHCSVQTAPSTQTSPDIVIVKDDSSGDSALDFAYPEVDPPSNHTVSEDTPDSPKKSPVVVGVSKDDVVVPAKTNVAGDARAEPGQTASPPPHDASSGYQEEVTISIFDLVSET